MADALQTLRRAVHLIKDARHPGDIKINCGIIRSFNYLGSSEEAIDYWHLLRNEVGTPKLAEVACLIDAVALDGASTSTIESIYEEALKSSDNWKLFARDARMPDRKMSHKLERIGSQALLKSTSNLYTERGQRFEAIMTIDVCMRIFPDAAEPYSLYELMRGRSIIEGNLCFLAACYLERPLQTMGVYHFLAIRLVTRADIARKEINTRVNSLLPMLELVRHALRKPNAALTQRCVSLSLVALKSSTALSPSAPSHIQKIVSEYNRRLLKTAIELVRSTLDAFQVAREEEIAWLWTLMNMAVTARDLQVATGIFGYLTSRNVEINLGPEYVILIQFRSLQRDLPGVERHWDELVHFNGGAVETSHLEFLARQIAPFECDPRLHKQGLGFMRHQVRKHCHDSDLAQSLIAYAATHHLRGDD